MRSQAKKIRNYLLCDSDDIVKHLRNNNKMLSKRLYVVENSVLAACSIGDRCCAQNASAQFPRNERNGINYNFDLHARETIEINLCSFSLCSFLLQYHD